MCIIGYWDRKKGKSGFLETSVKLVDDQRWRKNRSCCCPLPPLTLFCRMIDWLSSIYDVSLGGSASAERASWDPGAVPVSWADHHPRQGHQGGGASLAGERRGQHSPTRSFPSWKIRWICDRCTVSLSKQRSYQYLACFAESSRKKIKAY